MRNPEGPVPELVTTPLNWTDDEATRERKRMHYRALIAQVVLNNTELGGVALALKIGEVSAVASTRRDKELWIEEIHRAEEILSLVW